MSKKYQEFHNLHDRAPEGEALRGPAAPPAPAPSSAPTPTVSAAVAEAPPEELKLTDEPLPERPSEAKRSVEADSEVVRWVSMLIVLVAVVTIAILLAMMLYLPKRKPVAKVRPKPVPAKPAPKPPPKVEEVFEVSLVDKEAREPKTPFLTTLEIFEVPYVKEEAPAPTPVGREIRIADVGVGIPLKRSEKVRPLGECIPPITDFDRAVSLQMAGEDTDALDIYLRIVAKHPEHASSYNNMGIIYQKKRNYEKAVDAYNHAIAAEICNARIYNNLATCYIARGDHKQALIVLTRTLEKQPDNRAALINMGVTQTALRNFDAAEQSLLRALQLNPASARAIFNLANLYRWQRRDESANYYYNLFLDKSGGRYPEQEKLVRKLLSGTETQE